MNIKVHRGLDQIGGCITEISTETSRVFIDFGQNLPGNGEPTTPEEFWSYFDHKLYPYNTGETQPLFKISRKSQWGGNA